MKIPKIFKIIGKVVVLYTTLFIGYSYFFKFQKESFRKEAERLLDTITEKLEVPLENPEFELSLIQWIAENYKTGGTSTQIWAPTQRMANWFPISTVASKWLREKYENSS